MPPSPPPGTSISSSPTRGRTLKTTRAFPAGSLIATFNNPLLALPDGPSMRTTCNFCLRTASPETPKMLACTACKSVFYCSKNCQRLHWKSGVHKAECSMFDRVKIASKFYNKSDDDCLPPLLQAFMEFYAFTEAQAWEAVGYYRERFAVTGLYENQVSVPQLSQ